MELEIVKIASGGFVVRDTWVPIGAARPVVFACTSLDEAFAFIRSRFDLAQQRVEQSTFAQGER